MKSLFFTICLIAGLGYNAQSQKMATQLQSKKWYANGTVGKGALTLRAAETAKTDNQWQAVFSGTGRMSNCSTITKDVVDMSGLTAKAGTFYCDSSYVYSVINDKLSIMMFDKFFYYQIKALPNSEGIELTPISKDDFK